MSCGKSTDKCKDSIKVHGAPSVLVASKPVLTFKDIPRFTRMPTYRVGVPLDSLEVSIERYKEHYDLDFNPDFQRGYVWNNSQKTKFVEYVLRGGSSGKEIYFNHPGWDGSMNGQMVVVDGKQRLNACLEFLQDKVPVFDNYFYSEIQGHFPSFASLNFNVNNLGTRLEVLKWYKDLNSGGTIHTKEDLQKVDELIEEESKNK